MIQNAKHGITRFRPNSRHKRIGILVDDKGVTTTFRMILESEPVMVLWH